jgi:hypothetical protein
MIGFLNATSPAGAEERRQGKETGYVEGENIVIESREKT